MIEEPQGGGLRASDSDREAVVARLGEAHRLGRITAEEWGDRTEAAYRARTYGELDRLVADLPSPPEGWMSGSLAEDPWPAQWLRGVLELAVLAVIAEGPTYGYAITARLERAGLGRVKGGTLYPLLDRLADASAITAEWRDGEGGPGRKYFHLTGAGAARLDVEARRWRAFTECTRGLLNQTTREVQV